MIIAFTAKGSIAIFYTKRPISNEKSLRFLLQSFDDLLPVHQLLGDHSRDADHREASVVEFLVLLVNECIRVSWLQAQWVEIQIIAGLSVGAVSPPLTVLEGVVVVEDREDLWDGDAEEDSRPEVSLRPDLCPRLDGRTIEVAVEENRVLLGSKEAQCREHGDPAILQFGLAEETESAL